MFKPRPRQEEVLSYRGGMMGVSAVPGSGKTQTLSCLAAQLIAEGGLEDDQEILIVTLVNSAVNNFSSRVAGFMAGRDLLPNVGYRVRTLHGLAHDIVRERPALVGLESNFTIVDEHAAEGILTGACEAWISSHPYAADDYLSPDLDGRKQDWARRDKWPDTVQDLARSFIKKAKDLQAPPGLVWDCLREVHKPLPLVKMGLEIYMDYQQALSFRGSVDFDDLIRLALQALTLDEEYLERLQRRWPYILEDEAQDSSELQERILRLLARKKSNWVRVGDPNQAIYETFTTADPRFLREFLEETQVTPRELPNSGRSTKSILCLANELVRWTREEHPVVAVRDALADSLILPTPPGDPQPNPIDDPGKIHLVGKKFSPQEELVFTAESLARWLREEGQGQTAAALVPRNDRGEELVEQLKIRKIPCLELLRSTRSTRETAGALALVIRSLADPTAPARLAMAYRVFRRGERDDRTRQAQVDQAARLLQRCAHVEAYTHPWGGRDWLDGLHADEDHSAALAELDAFRPVAQRWQEAALMPADQLLLTVAQDLFHDAADLAVADKLAGALAGVAKDHPDWGLAELSEELTTIAKNERKFLGFSEEETGFEPDAHKGVVVVATIHKAKGLEWDRVHLLSVNSYDFPSGLPGDLFISEKWFLRDRLNLEAEALAQLEAVVHGDVSSFSMPEGWATQQARLDYVSERLRLLYVGITRARKELVVTWNNGRDGNQQPAVPLIALQEFWEGQHGRH
ncbi:MAG TPA: ATP-dependent helicase [Anaerolineaceae bacterium]|nr:ATP-dependent helicase [Anaerolineaceae bacterium]